jgi:hypothetical protein
MAPVLSEVTDGVEEFSAVPSAMVTPNSVERPLYSYRCICITDAPLADAVIVGFVPDKAPTGRAQIETPMPACPRESMSTNELSTLWTELVFDCTTAMTVLPAVRFTA